MRACAQHRARRRGLRDGQRGRRGAIIGCDDLISKIRKRGGVRGVALDFLRCGTGGNRGSLEIDHGHGLLCRRHVAAAVDGGPRHDGRAGREIRRGVVRDRQVLRTVVRHHRLAQRHLCGGNAALAGRGRKDDVQRRGDGRGNVVGLAHGIRGGQYGVVGVHAPVAEFGRPASVRLSGHAIVVDIPAHFLGCRFEDVAGLRMREQGVHREDQRHHARGVRTGARGAVERRDVVASGVPSGATDVGGVDLHTRRGNVEIGAVITSPPGFTVTGRRGLALFAHAHRRHGDGLVVIGRILHVAVAVPGRKEHRRTETSASELQRVVNGAVDERRRRTASPGVAQHIGAALVPRPVHAIGDDRIGGHPPRTRAVGDAHRDDAAAIGDAGDAETVVAHRRNDARTARAMRVVALRGAVASESGGVVAGQHVGEEIGMVQIHTLVDDGHPDRRRSRRDTPGVEHFQVRSGCAVVLRGGAGVVQRPLRGEKGIVGVHALQQTQEVRFRPLEDAAFVQRLREFKGVGRSSPAGLHNVHQRIESEGREHPGAVLLCDRIEHRDIGRSPQSYMHAVLQSHQRSIGVREHGPRMNDVGMRRKPVEQHGDLLLRRTVAKRRQQQPRSGKHVFLRHLREQRFAFQRGAQTVGRGSVGESHEHVFGGKGELTRARRRLEPEALRRVALHSAVPAQLCTDGGRQHEGEQQKGKNNGPHQCHGISCFPISE